MEQLARIFIRLVPLSRRRGPDPISRRNQPVLASPPVVQRDALRLFLSPIPTRPNSPL